MKKQLKKTPLEKKKSVLNVALNASSKAQLKRIEKANTSIVREQVPLGDLYMRVDKKWINKGKFCRLCSQPLAFNDIVIDKHRYVCNVLNKKKDED